MQNTEDGGARIRGACLMAIAAAAMLLACGSPTAAAPDHDTWPDRAQPMQVVLVRDARAACAPTCADWIAAQGKIVPGTAAAFDRVLRGLGKRRVPVFIDSSGGSVTEAIAIGRRIRAHHLDVVVTRTAIDACAGGKDATCNRGDAPRPGRPHGIGALCASACVLVLAAGTERDVAPWAFVGVHQIIVNGIRTQKQRVYRVLTRSVDGVPVQVDRTLAGERTISQTPYTAEPSERTYDMVAAYVTEMGIGGSLMPLMRSTPPSGMRILTQDEEVATTLVTAAIDGEYVATEAARAAAARPSSTIARSRPERAFLVAAIGEPGKSTTHIGRVTWRLDRSQPEVRGLMPVTLAADVEIPDMGLTALLTMTRVADLHTPPVMTLVFTPGPDATIRMVERISLPQPRGQGSQRSTALVGTVRTTGPNTFQIRLFGDELTFSSGEEAIKARPWLEIPLMFAGGTTGRLEIEHAESGTPVIAQAVTAWRAMPGDKALPAGATR